MACCRLIGSFDLYETLSLSAMVWLALNVQDQQRRHKDIEFQLAELMVEVSINLAHRVSRED